MSFANKVVIVTGGSSGIGKVTAKFFAEEGANVVVVGRNVTKLATTYAELKKTDKGHLQVIADVTNDDDAKRIIDKTISRFGKIDVLVNNAGIAQVSFIQSDTLLADYDEVMTINFRSIVNLTSLAAPHIIKSKGNMVNISSTAATAVRTPGLMPYSISKASLNQFSKCAALELAAFGVRVNIISAGPVDTTIFESIGIPNYAKSISPLLPLQRVSQPEEVAHMVLYLASDKAVGLTGTEFYVDNGLLLQ